MKTPFLVPGHGAEGVTTGTLICGCCLHRMGFTNDAENSICKNPICDQAWFTFPIDIKKSPQKQG